MSSVSVGRIDDRYTPEELVCVGARNDYRDEGVLEYEYAEIMDGASCNLDHLYDEASDAGQVVLVDDSIPPKAEGVVEKREKNGEDEYETHRYWVSDSGVRTRARQKTLLDHLMQGGHWGPFEHPACTIAIEGISRTAMAQLRTHRHFTFDVMSLRYVRVDTGELLETLDFEHDPKPFEDLFEYPEAFTADEVATRHGVEKVEATAEMRLRAVNHAYSQAADVYNELVDWKVPQEEARKILPMATKVNMVVSGNARAWMHLINIRGKANVQGEAREIVDGCFNECKQWMPYTFTRYDEMLPMPLTP
ncbi:FAD-dependent thymidylate synthase (plasmid) [Halorarum halophilum]|uniref:FAD-dependent thymidylate synthase n=1 Tax=Halorarum halophilum TaxID=2743090 RepID=A0A7D5GQ36_9EURY|nr:FAD-dependent thymidylate synthase [Halobaculum halophilum]QLG30144.1 FAD-dependent thymidylate synthase [Halobaculum halophilum]